MVNCIYVAVGSISMPSDGLTWRKLDLRPEIGEERTGNTTKGVSFAPLYPRYVGIFFYRLPINGQSRFHTGFAFHWFETEINWPFPYADPADCE